MGKYFITGGAGFIGSAFVRIVLEQEPEAEILNFDALTYAGNLENLSGVNSDRHKFVRGNICLPKEVMAALPETLTRSSISRLSRT
jgi:dTDP-glucose 4,6-dehydratase